MIRIDEEKCNGCGLCAEACHEGALALVNGKAKLVRDDFCDGMGDCLPACPQNALSFETREAAPYDEVAVQKSKTNIPMAAPGQIRHSGSGPLRQWPVQMKLIPSKAPYFDDADVVVAADCTAFACREFHERFVNGKVVMIGCPKLDHGDYTLKLKDILTQNNVKTVTTVRMEVPCCSGLDRIVRDALTRRSGEISYRSVVISTDGRVL